MLYLMYTIHNKNCVGSSKYKDKISEDSRLARIYKASSNITLLIKSARSASP